jgi:hypothetical protein
MKHQITICLLLFGCGAIGGDTTPAKLRADANKLRERVNAAHDRIRGGYDLAQLICETVRDEALRAPCDALDKAVQALDFTYTSARDALDLYESGLAAAEAVELLVAKYERAGDGVESISDKVTTYAQVIGDVARSCSRTDQEAEPSAPAEGSGAASDAKAGVAEPAGTERSADRAGRSRSDATEQPGSEVPKGRP